MAEIVYILCAVTSLLCTGLLIRAWARAPSRLLFWSAVCFAGLAVNSILVVIDMVFVPQFDLRAARVVAAAVGLIPLLVALITERE